MDIATKIELGKLLGTIDTLSRELSPEDALLLYRHLGTKQEALRKRLSVQGVFKKVSTNGNNGVRVIAAAVKVG
jgi:hypothetical protein